MCPISPPPPPLHQQRQNTDAVAPAALAHRTTLPPTTRQQQWKRDIAALMSSSTARSGRQYRFGPSLKPIEKLPYERTPEENADIARAEARNFFEGVKAKKHPPPEEKVDPVKAKRTPAALTKPPKSPPKGNYERIIGKEFAKAERSGSTVSDQRLKERRARKQIAQLGEQAKQSCPPLKVPSDIVTNNLGDYLPDDVHYDFMDVQIQRYEYGKPLVKGERSLTTMMRRLHD